jgi:hypothetical protein
MKNRRCTDVLFTLIFLAFAGLMVYIGIEAKAKGDPDAILNFVDEEGNLCGVGERAAYPYLYYIIWPDIVQLQQANLTPMELAKGRRLVDYTLRIDAQCVKECPLETDSSLECYGTNGITPANCLTPFVQEPIQ